jgi:hypothetical protein
MLTFIHEFHNVGQVIEFHVLKNNHWMFTGIIHEGFSKICTADAQYDFMSSETLSFAAQCNVCKKLIFASQNVERIGQMHRVAMPF